MLNFEFIRLADGVWSVRKDGREIGLVPETLGRRDARVIEGVLNGKPWVPGMWPVADEDRPDVPEWEDNPR